MAKASLIVPAYNVEEYLSRCLESIMCQTEKSIQIIIVNDGSSDRTLEIAEQYAQVDPRISVIDQNNRGLSGARNSGMDAATGDYIFFVDSDDWIEPNMVEEMVSWCETTASEVAVAGMIHDHHDKKEKLIYSDIRKQIELVIHRGVPIPEHAFSDNFMDLLGYATNKIYRREWLADSAEKFEEGLRLYEDVDFNARVLSKATRVAFMPQVFYHYVQRPRPTLVTIRDTSFLSVSLRAIRNFDFILEKWEVTTEVRKSKASKACANALWAALNGAASNLKSREFLMNLLNSSEADELIECASASRSRDWKGRWATFVIRRGLYPIGLTFFKVLQPIRKYKAHILKVC